MAFEMEAKMSDPCEDCGGSGWVCVGCGQPAEACVANSPGCVRRDGDREPCDADGCEDGAAAADSLDR